MPSAQLPPARWLCASRRYNGLLDQAGSLNRQSRGSGVTDDDPRAIFSSSAASSVPSRVTAPTCVNAAPRSRTARPIEGMPIGSVPVTASDAKVAVVSCEPGFGRGRLDRALGFVLAGRAPSSARLMALTASDGQGTNVVHSKGSTGPRHHRAIRFRHLPDLREHGKSLERLFVGGGVLGRLPGLLHGGIFARALYPSAAARPKPTHRNAA